jgi:tripeptide aminopeptidase
MDIDRLTRSALAIQAVPAPPFGEGRRTAFVRDSFEAIGLTEIETDGTGNLIACAPGGSSSPVVVTAHLDSVFAPEEVWPAKESGGRLLGPGVGDNAIAVAALTEMGRDLLDQPAASPVWLVATVGEEGLGNLRGMRAIVDRFGAHPRAYIVLEGMAFGRVYHRALPSERYRIDVATAGGHSWIHFGRPSATHILVETLSRLLSLPLPDDPRSSFNIGTICGGSGINRLAESATCEVELRSEDVDTLRRLVDEMTRRVELPPGKVASVRLIHLGSRPGGELPAEHPLVKAAQQAVQSTAHMTPALSAGSTDASLPISLGLPAICIGITRGGCAHSDKEYVEIAPIEQGYNAALATVRLASRLD